MHLGLGQHELLARRRIGGGGRCGSHQTWNCSRPINRPGCPQQSFGLVDVIGPACEASPVLVMTTSCLTLIGVVQLSGAHAHCFCRGRVGSSMAKLAPSHEGAVVQLPGRDLSAEQLDYLASPTGRQILRRAAEQAGFDHR